MTMHQTLDLVAKILGICVVLFGVYKYFNDLAESRDRERREAALGYVERFNEPGFLKDRLELDLKWLPYAGIIARTEEQTVPRDVHARLANQIALDDPERRMTFERIVEFLSDAVLCSSTEVCDSEIIGTRFCSKIASVLELYAPVIAERRKAFLTPTYAVTLEQFAEADCGIRLPNLEVHLH